MAFDVQDKGEGIFFFKREFRGCVSLGGITGPSAIGYYTEDNFAEELARLRRQHPSLEVASIVPEHNEARAITGYLVICNS